jgi:hypothetical protein
MERKAMIDGKAGSRLERERIDIGYDYAVCAWARHFNTSEQRVKEAVQAVGDRADKVRDHLAGQGRSERPSAR